MTAPRPEILVVDDERTIRAGLKAALEGEGWAVRTARDGAEAVAAVSDSRPDLVLLDVMMPKMDGFAACEEIRKSDPLLPVVFLTAKDADADQLRGLGLGADDYVSKTASEEVLFARVRRALERASAMEDPPANAGAVRLGAVSVDLLTLEVRSGGKSLARLTKTEADILRILDAGRGRRFTADELIAALRGEGFACEDTMIYVHVSNLRRKLGSAASQLSTIRGAGYALLG